MRDEAVADIVYITEQIIPGRRAACEAAAAERA
jgi:hypothetical protein